MCQSRSVVTLIILQHENVNQCKLIIVILTDFDCGGCIYVWILNEYYFI